MKKLVALALSLGVLGIGIYQMNQPEQVVAHGSFAKAYTDVSASQDAQHVVIGKVKKKVKSYVKGWPQTELLIETEQNVKGELPSQFIFVQDGGLDEEANQFVTFENYELLKPGKSYLFFLNKVNEQDEITSEENGLVKYWSIGGPQTVYEINDKKVKNLYNKQAKELKELENIIKENK
jgi:hypothetical protein